MKEVLEFNKKLSFEKKLVDKKYSIQFLPDCLSLISQNKYITFKGKKIKSSYLIDLTHNLILKFYFKKENSFNLSSLVLKEKYGHLYNYYLDYLKEHNILILVKKHMKGKNCRIYKLNDSVLKGKIVRFKNDDRTLLKKYKNAVSSILKSDITNNKILPEIKKKLVDDLFFVDIDYSRSIFFLDASIQDRNIYNRNIFSVECINDKHIFYHFDSYGRMHTNFTILKSFIRKNCLLIDGDETYETDIKNSQPLFLCKIIESTPQIPVNYDEYNFYRHLTNLGKFYDFFIENTTVKDKKTIKECVYKVFFGKNYPNKFDKMFENLFPTIYKFIKEYKKLKGDYRILAHDLQNLESDLIFNHIVREIISTNPDIKLITVHDSIICSQKYRDFVHSIFTNKLNDFFSQKEPFSKINTSEGNNIYSYV